MRPISIRWFERLFLAAFALGLPFGVLETWQVLVSDPEGKAYLLVFDAIPLTIWCSFWFFISRRASNIAKWLWTVYVAFKIIGPPILSGMAGGDFFGALLLHGTLGVVADIGSLSLSVAATVMLFRPDATRWLASRGKPIDASIFS